MAAALEAGVSRLFRMGGAHAVAALAYGTGTVPRVDKIVGPGNRYVRRGKGARRRATAPSTSTPGRPRLSIVAGGGRAAWIAADLVAQAEHDPDARAVFITWNAAWRRGRGTCGRRAGRGRSIAARRSLATHGVVVVARDADEAMALANRLAPEHLVVETERLRASFDRAGSVFVGP